MAKLFSSFKPKQQTIDLNKVSWRNKIIAGLVDFDQLLLNIKFSIRVEGNYVNFKILTNSSKVLLKLRIKKSTFNNLYLKFVKIKKDIDKASENTI